MHRLFRQTPVQARSGIKCLSSAFHWSNERSKSRGTRACARANESGESYIMHGPNGSGIEPPTRICNKGSARSSLFFGASLDEAYHPGNRHSLIGVHRAWSGHLPGTNCNHFRNTAFLFKGMLMS
jgi:hypothetical protein